MSGLSKDALYTGQRLSFDPSRSSDVYGLSRSDFYRLWRRGFTAGFMCGTAWGGLVSLAVYLIHAI